MLRLSACCAVLIACSATETATVFVEAPTSGSSILVALAGKEARAAGVEPGMAGPVSFSFDDPGPIELFEAQFPCSLAWLGARSALDVGGGGAPIPPQSALRARTWQDGAFTEWSALDERPVALRDLRISVRPPGWRCVEASIRRVEIPDSATDTGLFITAALPLGGDRVLLAYDRAKQPVIMTPGGGAPHPSLPAEPYLAGHRLPDGRLLLVRGDGAALESRDDGLSFTVGPIIDPGLSDLTYLADGGRMVSAPPDQGGETYYFSHRRTLYRFDGTAWSLVDALPSESVRSVRVAWLAPGRVMVTDGNGPDLYVLEGGRLRAVRAFASIDDNPVSVAAFPLLGVLVGSSRGNLARQRPDGGWAEVPLANSTHGIRAIAALDDGAIFGGGFTGFLNQVHPQDLHICGSADPVGVEYEHIVPTESGVFLPERFEEIGRPLAGLYWSRITPPGPSCR